MRYANTLTTALAGVVAASLLSFGCTDPEAPPPLSLEGPTKIAELAFCLVGADKPRLRVAPERCEGEEFEGEVTRILQYGYISNQMGDSVAVASFNTRPPTLLDTSRGIPGVTHIPVGRVPTEVATSADGNFVFVYNQVSRDISVVSDDLRREVHRIFIGEPATGMTRVRGRDALWLLGAESESVIEVSWTFTCEEEGVYIEGCEPQLQTAVSPVYQFEPGSRPRFITHGASDGRAFVIFAEKAYAVELALADTEEEPASCIDGAASAPCKIAEYGLAFGCSDGLDNDGDGLIDADDPQCLDPRSAESDVGLGRGVLTACHDGIDNDGDGRTDAEDGGCYDVLDQSETGAVLTIACSDGLDNDGDGLTDADDPECNFADAWTPNHGSEAARPGCSDGVDNDDDGLVDLDDPQCSDPAQPDEAVDVAEDAMPCSDGLDNDGDGATDLDDPGCSTPRSENELFGPRPCSDGLDNDGDGFTDYPADPDCYGVMGYTESSTEAYQFGPMAVDPEGRYAYVIDRAGAQVVIIDLESRQTVDSNLARPFEGGIGVPVSVVPQSIIARRVDVAVASYDDPELGTLTLVQTLLFANVASTRGLIQYVEAAEIYRVLDENEEVVLETINPLYTLGDSDPSPALAGTTSCDLDDRMLERVESLADGGERITCESDVIPRLVPVDEDADPALADRPVAIITDQVEIIGPYTQEDADEDAQNPDLEVGELVKKTVERTRDFSIPSDTWTVTYEGTILERDDALVDQDDPRLIRSQGANFCTAGIRAGDLLTIESSPTQLSSMPDADCTPYEGKELTYRITKVRGSKLVISVLGSEDLADLNRDADEDPIVSVLPERACFGAGIAVRVRADGEWIVAGDRRGLVVDEMSVADMCVPRTGIPTRTSRAQTGEVFENSYFTFKIEPGAAEPTRDFRITFRTASEYGVRNLRSGSSASDMLEIRSATGNYIPVLDVGTNVVRVWYADRGTLATIFF